MGLIITTDDKGTKVFRQDKTSAAGNPYTTYAISVSSKDKDGAWQSCFINCAFKKGVEVNNKAVINIKNAFFTVDSYQNKKSLRLFILDFDVIEQGEGAPVAAPNNGFMQIPDGIENDLPFK